MPPTNPSPIAAALLSFLWPGIGHMYAGRPRAGLRILVAFLMLVTLVFVLSFFASDPTINRFADLLLSALFPAVPIIAYSAYCAADTCGASLWRPRETPYETAPEPRPRTEDAIPAAERVIEIAARVARDDYGRLGLDPPGPHDANVYALAAASVYARIEAGKRFDLAFDLRGSEPFPEVGLELLCGFDAKGARLPGVEFGQNILCAFRLLAGTAPWLDQLPEVHEWPPSRGTSRPRIGLCERACWEDIRHARADQAVEHGWGDVLP